MPQAQHVLNAILEKYFQFLQIAINTFIFKGIFATNSNFLISISL